MVTPIDGNVTFPDPIRGPEFAFQPPFPRPQADPFQTQPADDLIQAQRRAQEQAARRAEEARGQEPVRLRLEAPQVGVQFRVLEEIGVTQARVVDRISREVLREVPTTDKLRFRAQFDRVLGRFLDVEV